MPDIDSFCLKPFRGLFWVLLLLYGANLRAESSHGSSLRLDEASDHIWCAGGNGRRCAMATPASTGLGRPGYDHECLTTAVAAVTTTTTATITTTTVTTMNGEGFVTARAEAATSAFGDGWAGRGLVCKVFGFNLYSCLRRGSVALILGCVPIDRRAHSEQVLCNQQTAQIMPAHLGMSRARPDLRAKDSNVKATR